MQLLPQKLDIILYFSVSVESRVLYSMQKWTCALSLLWMTQKGSKANSFAFVNCLWYVKTINKKSKVDFSVIKMCLLCSPLL